MLGVQFNDHNAQQRAPCAHIAVQSPADVCPGAWRGASAQSRQQGLHEMAGRRGCASGRSRLPRVPCSTPGTRPAIKGQQIVQIQILVSISTGFLLDERLRALAPGGSRPRRLRLRRAGRVSYRFWRGKKSAASERLSACSLSKIFSSALENTTGSQDALHAQEG